MAEKKTRLEVQKTYKMYVDGKFPRSESGRYYKLENNSGKLIANICLGSRKDLRDAVVAARKAFDGWQSRSAYNRSQILYRIAETLEGRKAQFTETMKLLGVSSAKALNEWERSVDLLVYYAGWADKYQQVFSAVNPVESAHFNFSYPEPTGVVSVIAPSDSALLGLVAAVIPVITGGNTAVVLASEKMPLAAIEFAEVIHASDLPPGVVNIITGKSSELLLQFASHMDVNAVVYCNNNAAERKSIELTAPLNVKRVVHRETSRGKGWETGDPYQIMDLQEIKTTWHPIGI